MKPNIKQTTLALLSRRDHSKKELQQKLAKKYPIAEILQILDEFSARGLINEMRYAENYIRSRRQKGYGPNRINAELESRGIPATVIAEQLKITDNEWLHDMTQLWRKRFKGQLPKDFKIKAKQMRFLYYRGFTKEQIEELLETVE